MRAVAEFKWSSKLYLAFTSAAGKVFAEAPRWHWAERYRRPGCGRTPCGAGVSESQTYRCSSWTCCGGGSLSRARHPGAGGCMWRLVLDAEVWVDAVGNLMLTVSSKGLRLAGAHWTSWPGLMRAALRKPASPKTGSTKTGGHYQEQNTVKDSYLCPFKTARRNTYI